MGRICESGSRRESEQVPEQKTGNRARFRREENGDETCVKSAAMRGKTSVNLPEKAGLKNKQEKAKGSRGFPFAVHICRQCRQNKGFSTLRIKNPKGVVKVEKTEKRSQKSEIVNESKEKSGVAPKTKIFCYTMKKTEVSK